MSRKPTRKHRKERVIRREYGGKKPKPAVHHVVVPPTHKVIITPLEVQRLEGYVPTYSAKFEFWDTIKGENKTAFATGAMSEVTCRFQLVQNAVLQGWTRPMWFEFWRWCEDEPDDAPVVCSHYTTKELHEPE